VSSPDTRRAGSSAVRAFCHPPHGHGRCGPVRPGAFGRVDAGHAVHDGRRRPRQRSGAGPGPDLPSRVVAICFWRPACSPSAAIGRSGPSPKPPRAHNEHTPTENDHQ